MTEKRYNTYCDQNENQTVIDDDLNNTHIFIAYCENLNDAIRLKTALNSITDELNALHEENTHLRNDNLKAFALLGDIRALARRLLQQDKLDTIIEKIDKFEKEIMEWLMLILKTLKNELKITPH